MCVVGPCCCPRLADDTPGPPRPRAVCRGGGGGGTHTANSRQQTAAAAVNSRQAARAPTPPTNRGLSTATIYPRIKGDHTSRLDPPPKRTLTTTATRPHPPTFHHLQHHHPRPRCACVRPTNHTRQPSSTSAPCLVHPGVNRHPQGHCQRLCARHLSTEGQGEGPRFEGGWGPAGGEGGTRPVCVGGGGGRGAGGWRGGGDVSSRAAGQAGQQEGVYRERERGGGRVNGATLASKKNIRGMQRNRLTLAAVATGCLVLASLPPLPEPPSSTPLLTCRVSRRVWCRPLLLQPTAGRSPAADPCWHSHDHLHDTA